MVARLLRHSGRRGRGVAAPGCCLRHRRGLLLLHVGVVLGDELAEWSRENSDPQARCLIFKILAFPLSRVLGMDYGITPIDLRVAVKMFSNN